MSIVLRSVLGNTLQAGIWPEESSQDDKESGKKKKTEKWLEEFFYLTWTGEDCKEIIAIFK